MSDYFNSVRQFASSTFNTVAAATTSAVQQAAPQFITIGRNQYQILEKHGEVTKQAQSGNSFFLFFLFFFFSF